MLLEGYYLRDIYGDIYAVKGVTQPPGRVYAIPKIVRELGTLKTLQDAMGYIAAVRPEYLYKDPHTGRVQPAVPVDMIDEKIEPALLIPPSIPGTLREKAAKLVSLITDGMGQSVKIGFTGSIRLGTARPDSDIDIVAYGVKHGLSIYKTMRELRELKITECITPSAADTVLKSRRDTVLASLMLERHDTLKVLTGVYSGSIYMVKLVPMPDEYWEDWDGTSCVSLGRACVLVEIVDDSCGIFTPSLYRVRVREAYPSMARVSSIISFRSRFAEHCKVGELVMASGTLEEVRRGSTSYLRLSVGWDPGDYIVGM